MAEIDPSSDFVRLGAEESVAIARGRRRVSILWGAVQAPQTGQPPAPARPSWLAQTRALRPVGSGAGPTDRQAAGPDATQPAGLAAQAPSCGERGRSHRPASGRPQRDTASWLGRVLRPVGSGEGPTDRPVAGPSATQPAGSDACSVLWGAGQAPQTGKWPAPARPSRLARTRGLRPAGSGAGPHRPASGWPRCDPAGWLGRARSVLWGAGKVPQAGQRPAPARHSQLARTRAPSCGERGRPHRLANGRPRRYPAGWLRRVLRPVGSGAGPTDWQMAGPGATQPAGLDARAPSCGERGRPYRPASSRPRRNPAGWLGRARSVLWGAGQALQTGQQPAPTQPSRLARTRALRLVGSGAGPTDRPTAGRGATQPAGSDAHAPSCRERGRPQRPASGQPRRDPACWLGRACSVLWGAGQVPQTSQRPAPAQTSRLARTRALRPVGSGAGPTDRPAAGPSATQPAFSDACSVLWGAGQAPQTGKWPAPALPSRLSRTRALRPVGSGAGPTDRQAAGPGATQSAGTDTYAPTCGEQGRPHRPASGWPRRDPAGWLGRARSVLWGAGKVPQTGQRLAPARHSQLARTRAPSCGERGRPHRLANGRPLRYPAGWL
ncbi:translation initiation factor IF-2-like [Schistocerca gregaria]|uniref:translation initiation factor IF-2-like n=1 Tax=Schistocerca gregaria TaxID=7010 RepID=UPI00211E5C01|nr:translation initiation factor IF-2-like [Schistocerca gregaria]